MENTLVFDTGTAATGWVSTDTQSFSLRVDASTKGINPLLYFKYIKSKFKVVERKKIDRKVKEIEKAFEVAVENGQNVLAEKFLEEITLMGKEAMIYGKGVKKYIDREDLMKYKNSIREGHISNTYLKDFTRVIPNRVTKELDKVKHLYDAIEIWHYWNEDAKDVKKMTREEKEKMKDPVMFGLINGSKKMYFIADWEDDYCDLTFREMSRVVAKQKRKK